MAKNRRRGAGAAGRRGHESRVRIIGGAWRRRWLSVADVQGLRPTADALRETLFNWLQPHLPGARVLDLYAGTGALGFEAASRGAQSVLLVERDRRAVARLQQAVEELGASGVEVRCADAARLLEAGPDAAAPFHVVFLDPPFERDLLAPALRTLAGGGWLAPGGRVYVELEAHRDPAEVTGAQWHILRERTAGQARGLLLEPAEPLFCSAPGHSLP
ncbi:MULTISPECIES: 16S rRNA (guanine(966)-N(2))-methyltransferase RsmD [Thioalkalivibrio]|uniref:Ribosomal RNA small subunit methyltransferase D n=1 Tax=Thioalkalivibrio halophilus TaxID=252474 RepID=A0A1V3A1L6_9GAMM|nr:MULTISPECIES: 16S rRNA (guanine(966)-N(2))-methyltransferase RsmD [Thioalkalivibrio]OOC11288.1 16S rRNA (guanine(966)-N(2))-methyltransferase RsmD [Thioalkalivibrio halophilus]